jgi:hypothetical protein
MDVDDEVCRYMLGYYYLFFCNIFGPPFSLAAPSLFLGKLLLSHIFKRSRFPPLFFQYIIFYRKPQLFATHIFFSIAFQ